MRISQFIVILGLGALSIAEAPCWTSVENTNNYYGWPTKYGRGYVFQPSGLETAESCVKSQLPADAKWV